MNTLELEQLLNQYNQELEKTKLLNMQSWALNLQSLEAIQASKARSKMRGLISLKSIGIVLGIVWIGFLARILIQLFQQGSIFFIISVIAIIGFTALAIGLYVYHIVLIRNIDHSDEILVMQQKIAKLKLATLKAGRILFLQAPFYTTFWWNLEMIQSAPLAFWGICVPITLLFVWASVWLYRNSIPANIHKKWFRILNSPDWDYLEQASRQLQQVEEYKKSI